MARVTVEDCVDKVHDRFELVLLAGQRSKNIASGEPLTIERNNEKNTVLSLREIAAESVKVDGLRESLVRHNQRMRSEDEDLAAGEAEQKISSEAAKEIKDFGVMEENLTDSPIDEDGEGSFEEENLDVDD